MSKTYSLKRQEGNENKRENGECRRLIGSIPAKQVIQSNIKEQNADGESTLVCTLIQQSRLSKIE